MTFRYALFVLLTLLLTSLIGYGTVRTARLLKSWQPEGNILLMPADNFLRVCMVFLCIGLGWLSGLPDGILGWSAADAGRQILWGIGWGIVLAGLFSLITFWVRDFLNQHFYSDMVLKYILPQDALEFLLVSIVMISVVMLEELLFRSLLLGGLSPLLPVPALIVITGVGFGLLHSPQGLVGMLGAGLAGILFGLLFLQAQSLLMPLVAHYVTNMLQIGLAAYRQELARSADI